MIYIDGIKVEFLEYPSGEWGISNFDKFPINPKLIEWKTEKGWEREFIFLKLWSPFPRPKLRIDFLPLSREDKTENGRFDLIEPLVHLLWESYDGIVLETFHPTKDIIFSDLSYIDNSKLMNLLQDFISKELNHESRLLFVFPDASAVVRYEDEVTPKIHKNWYYDVVVAQKSRNKETGQIINSNCFSEDIQKIIKDLNPTNIIMIDDICSYGGSFARITKEINGLLDYKPQYDLFVYADEKQTPNKAIEEGINIHSIKEINFK